MKKILLLACALFCVGVASAETIHVSRFGAKPNDGKDDTNALRKAAEYCRLHPHTTLLFAEGTYILRDKEAIETENRCKRGEFGPNPEAGLFRPYTPYVKGLDFYGSVGTTVLAYKTLLLVDGWMEPVSIENCKDFTLKGLTIDHVRKPFSRGEVIRVDSASFDVRFNPEQLIDDKIPMPRMTFYLPQQDRIHRDPIYFAKREVLGRDNIVRFHHAMPQTILGSEAVALHSFHSRPAILIQRSENTLLEDVTILSQPGMGITGWESKNVLMRRLSVRPAAGYHQSTNTDATHFACCEGLIRYENCYFEACGDDVTNVHGYYQTIVSTDGTKAKLRVKAPTFTHTQIIDAPYVGDTLELVSKKSLAVVDKYVVTASVLDRPNLSTDVQLDKALPADFENYYLMDITKLPRLEFVNSTINSHLSRGMMVKTRGVLIEGNNFRYTTGTAIHVGAESWWSEGSHSEDVVIRNNRIIGCGQGMGTQGDAAGIAVIIEAEDTKSGYLHKNFVIENNTIIGENDKRGVFIGNAENVKLVGNEIIGCDEKIYIRSSSGVAIE